MPLIVMKGVPYTEERLLEWLAQDGYVIVETKRDEFRCLATCADGELVFKTASGGVHYNIPREFYDCVLDMMDYLGVSTIDMGLSVNESFDLTRRTLKASKKPYDLTGNTVHEIVDGTKKNPIPVYNGLLRLRAYLYDLPEYKLSYRARRKMMTYAAQRHPCWSSLPEQGLCYNTEEVNEFFENAVDLGHEGVMLKRKDHLWAPKRTSDWMKMKPEEERDGLIVGWNPGTPGTDFEGLVGSVMFEFSDGSRADASGMTMAERLDMTHHFVSKYLHKIGTMKYMQRDAQNGYRHPIYVRLHEEKTELCECE